MMEQQGRIEVRRDNDFALDRRGDSSRLLSTHCRRWALPSKIAGMMRTVPVPVVRTIAAIGVALWVVPAIEAFFVNLIGLLRWTSPYAYVAWAVLVGGLLVNLTLLARAKTLSPLAVIMLLLVSLSFSVLVVSLIASVAMTY